MTTEVSSAGRAQHSEPTITLYGRVAAGVVGYISFPDPPDLHFSVVIDDAYNGIRVIDGQPTFGEAGLRNAGLIRTSILENTLPTGAKVRIPLTPPEGMSRQEFARQLVARARDFSSYVSPYSAPQNIRGARMRPGEYNSSSYLAGLLKSVMGYVPLITVPSYQAPGWESPMPGHYFKGEAIR